MSTTLTPLPTLPKLVRLIDNCESREDARSEYELASLKDRREAAQHLGVPMGALYLALLTRVSRRLNAAAQAAVTV